MLVQYSHLVQNMSKHQSCEIVDIRYNLDNFDHTYSAKTG